MVKFLDSIKINLLTIITRFLYGSCKWNIQNFNNIETLIKDNKSFIIAFWHGSMMIPYFKLAKHKFHVLAGLHKDAELGVRVGEKLGWKFLRGSSSDKGKEVFQEIVSYLNKSGNVLAITPDGPKGPAKVPKPGAIRAAQKTSVPIIPVAGFSNKYWGLKNWDLFYITKPFSSIELKFGSPLYFSEEDKFDNCVNILKDQLDNLESEVKKYLSP